MFIKCVFQREIVCYLKDWGDFGVESYVFIHKKADFFIWLCANCVEIYWEWWELERLELHASFNNINILTVFSKKIKIGSCSILSTYLNSHDFFLLIFLFYERLVPHCFNKMQYLRLVIHKLQDNCNWILLICFPSTIFLCVTEHLFVCSYLAVWKICLHSQLQSELLLWLWIRNLDLSCDKSGSSVMKFRRKKKEKKTPEEYLNNLSFISTSC